MVKRPARPGRETGQDFLANLSISEPVYLDQVSRRPLTFGLYPVHELQVPAPTALNEWIMPGQLLSNLVKGKVKLERLASDLIKSIDHTRQIDIDPAKITP